MNGGHKRQVVGQERNGMIDNAVNNLRIYTNLSIWTTNPRFNLAKKKLLLEVGIGCIFSKFWGGPSGEAI